MDVEQEILSREEAMEIYSEDLHSIITNAIEYSWEYKLVYHIHGDEKFISFDTIGLYRAISMLTDKEQSVIILKYREKYTQAKIAKQFGISSSRVAQIIAKAERRLKHQNMAKLYLTMTLSEAEELRQENLKLQGEMVDLKRSLNVTDDMIAHNRLMHEELYNLGIPFRVTRILCVKGIKTVGDVIECTYEDLLKFRNLGATGVRSIIDALNKYNLHLKEDNKNE